MAFVIYAGDKFQFFQEMIIIRLRRHIIGRDDDIDVLEMLRYMRLKISTFLLTSIIWLYSQTRTEIMKLSEPVLQSGTWYDD